MTPPASSPLRTVFMGTPEFAVPTLEALVRQKNLCELLAVYTQPDRPAGRRQALKAPPIKHKALELKIPVFQPEKLSQPGEFEKLNALQPDIIVVVAYGQILKTDILKLPPLGCVNIHSSLLPRWRGAAPIQWAILSGDTETGVTTMRIAERLDSGNILLQTKTPLLPTDTAGTLHDRLSRLGAELIVPTLIGLREGTLKDTPQDEASVTFAPKLNKEMEVLNPAQSALELDRQIRALNPWPGTSVWVELPLTPPSTHTQPTLERLKIKEAIPHPNLSEKRGWIFERTGMVLLGTSQGSLELRRFQWDGKSEINANGFLNGLRGKGLRLPLEIKSKPA